jgi:2Fe-2S ferredoxin
MPTLTVQNLPAAAAVPVLPGATLLSALQAAGLDWMHACGAKGRCTTCRLIVTSGAEGLTPPTGPELRYRTAGRLQATERLTCQACLSEGHVAGRVPESTKLPHQQYSQG